VPSVGCGSRVYSARSGDRKGFRRPAHATGLTFSDRRQGGVCGPEALATSEVLPGSNESSSILMGQKLSPGSQIWLSKRASRRHFVERALIYLVSPTGFEPVLSM
jgi:hypothetical protein